MSSNPQHDSRRRRGGVLAALSATGRREEARMRGTILAAMAEALGGSFKPVKNRRAPETVMASTSAVAQITGASGLTEASPVSMPTLSGPSSSHRAKNFSDASALMGEV